MHFKLFPAANGAAATPPRDAGAPAAGHQRRRACSVRALFVRIRLSITVRVSGPTAWVAAADPPVSSPRTEAASCRSPRSPSGRPGSGS
jgi:hypothetical protein